jgi:hypothetical protein
MKATRLILVGLISMSATYGATVDALNLSATVVGSRILVDSTNATLSSGYAAIGYFSNFSTTLDFQGATGAQLEADFNILGSSVSTFQDTSFGQPINGIFSVSGSGPTVDGGVGGNFVDELAFLVIGNGATLATSTEAFIFATGVLFSADPSTPVTIDLSGDPFRTNGNPSTGTILFGSGDGVANIFLGATDLGQVTNGLKTATLVPEPSALLLSAIGALALLRRKR